MTEVKREDRRGRKRENAFPVIPLRKRLRTGVEAGLIMGILFSGFAVLNALFNGGEVRTRYSDEGFSLLAVLFSYLVLGPVTGFLYGLLFPLMRVRLLAYLTGVLASVPFSFFVAVTVGGEAWRSEPVLFVGGIMALTLGGVGGVFIRAASME